MRFKIDLKYGRCLTYVRVYILFCIFEYDYDYIEITFMCKLTMNETI